MWSMLTAGSTHRSGFWDLPQAASLGLPGRSMSWGHGCRRVGTYTSSSRKGSPCKTGTWAQGRMKHRSETPGEPKAEGLRLWGLGKHFSTVRETTLKHPGRANLIQSQPFYLQVLGQPSLSGLLPCMRAVDKSGPQGLISHYAFP